MAVFKGLPFLKNSLLIDVGIMGDSPKCRKYKCPQVWTAGAGDVASVTCYVNSEEWRGGFKMEVRDAQ